MVEREQITGTPFTLIKSEDKWFMVMGDYRVTETTNTKEEQIEKLETEKWLLIMHICIIATEKMQKQNIITLKENQKLDKERTQNERYETETTLIPQEKPIK